MEGTIKYCLLIFLFKLSNSAGKYKSCLISRDHTKNFQKAQRKNFGLGRIAQLILISDWMTLTMFSRASQMRSAALRTWSPPAAPPCPQTWWSRTRSSSGCPWPSSSPSSACSSGFVGLTSRCWTPRPRVFRSSAAASDTRRGGMTVIFTSSARISARAHLSRVRRVPWSPLKKTKRFLRTYACFLFLYKYFQAVAVEDNAANLEAVLEPEGDDEPQADTPEDPENVTNDPAEEADTGEAGEEDGNNMMNSIIQFKQSPFPGERLKRIIMRNYCSRPWWWGVSPWGRGPGTWWPGRGRGRGWGWGGWWGGRRGIKLSRNQDNVFLIRI